MNKSLYESYIQSNDWKQMVKTHKDTKCFCCGYKSNLELHHITYERLGNELPQDLVTLCSKCHKEVHVIRNKDKVSLENSHFELLKRNKATKKNNRNFRNSQNVKYNKLSQPCKKVLFECGFTFGHKPTEKAFLKKYAIESDSQILWNLGKCIKLLQSNKKYHKSLNSGKFIPLILKKQAFGEDAT